MDKGSLQPEYSTSGLQHRKGSGERAEGRGKGGMKVETLSKKPSPSSSASFFPPPPPSRVPSPGTDYPLPSRIIALTPTPDETNPYPGPPPLKYHNPRQTLFPTQSHQPPGPGHRRPVRYGTVLHSGCEESEAPAAALPRDSGSGREPGTRGGTVRSDSSPITLRQSYPIGSQTVTVRRGAGPRAALAGRHVRSHVGDSELGPQGPAGLVPAVSSVLTVLTGPGRASEVAVTVRYGSGRPRRTVTGRGARLRRQQHMRA
eukprot:753835-Hanusia_phi.AAC.3